MDKIKQILKKYYRIKKVSETTLLRESPDNLVYRVSSPGVDKYVLRISKRSADKNIAFELDVLERMYSKGAKIVPAVLNTDNDFYTKIDTDTFYTLFKHAKGDSVKISSNTKPQPEKVSLVGSALGELHNISTKINSDYKNNRTIFSEIERILSNRYAFIDTFINGDKFINTLEKYLKWASSKNEKTGIINNDYRPSNIFFHQEKVSAILDFDWACTGPLIKDVALGAVEWSFPDGNKEYWKTQFETFIEGYNSSSNNKISIDSDLYKWAAFSCLSDTCTYFADLIANKDGDTGKEEVKSYMYKKFLFFEELSKTT